MQLSTFKFTLHFNIVNVINVELPATQNHSMYCVNHLDIFSIIKS